MHAVYSNGAFWYVCLAQKLSILLYFHWICVDWAYGCQAAGQSLYGWPRTYIESFLILDLGTSSNFILCLYDQYPKTFRYFWEHISGCT